MSRILVAIALLATAAAVTTRGQQDAPRRPWPPGVQAVSQESPALTPEQERDTFHLAPGYRVELVASEPLVQDPVAIDWAPDGRLWVVEMPGFMPDIAATGEHDPIGRIVVLEDSDRDGRMDRRTVFADGLVLARSVKVLEHGVLVAEPPDLWLMRDTDGDLRMDTKTRVTGQFGQRDVDVENNANGLDWGLDNRLRTAGQSRLEFRWKAGTLVAVPAPVRGQWGVTHDDVGRTFRNSNESALHVDVVADEYFARHPQLLRTRGSYERLAMPDNDLNTVWPVRSTPGINRGYQAGIRRSDGTLARYTSVCAPLVYRGDRLPAAGSVFVAEPAANLVSRIDLREDGATVQAARAWGNAEFLASSDERFRPVYLSNAPDGALYLVDLYRGVVEHRLSLTTYLKSYIETQGLLNPRGLGRIWRIVHEDQPRDTSPMATRTAEDLVALLSHPTVGDAIRRSACSSNVAMRQSRRCSPGCPTTPTSHARDCMRCGRSTGSMPSPSLTSRRHGTIVHRTCAPRALRIAERWLDAPTPALRATIEAATEDADPRVRLQAAASLGALKDDRAKWDAMATLLARRGDDPVLADIVLSGARGAESTILERILEQSRRGDGPLGGPAAPTPATDAITMLTATMLRAAREQDAQQWLARVAGDGPTSDAATATVGPALRARPLENWQREALMHGAEIGILGAPVPGQQPPLPAASGVTCPTCPGGRQSSGGDYAFEWPAAANAYTRPGVAAPPLRLRRPPDAFVTLAGEDSPLGRQAAAVLTRVSWPGKPGDPDAPAPLTTAEQQRFDEGRRIYEAMCQACHQADGRGQSGRAASLVGSALALAPPEMPVRILLNGKEGSTGLMPALGAAMTDTQVSSVLTYVRREWGHGGSAVDAAVVARQRSLNKSRTRPWTDGELVGRDASLSEASMTSPLHRGDGTARRAVPTFVGTWRSESGLYLRDGAAVLPDAVQSGDPAASALESPMFRASFSLARRVFAAAAIGLVSARQPTPSQPVLGTRTVKVLEVGGLKFKDLNKNGKLDVYEDWRKPVDARADDLVSQMTLEEKAGLMVSPTLTMGADGAVNEESRPMPNPFGGPAWSLPGTSEAVLKMHSRQFINRANTSPRTMVTWLNGVQQIAESSRLGIPAFFVTNPRNHLGGAMVVGIEEAGGSFSQWPGTLGLAATRDAALVEEFSRIAAEEYVAVGIRGAYHPQMDLATEPRWARISGTFGEDADLTSEMVRAMLRGFQGKTLGPKSVALIVKHFPGGGPAIQGQDSHFEFGKYDVYPGKNFDYHVKPFKAAIDAGAVAIMPYYSIPKDITPEQVGMSYNKAIVTDLLRDRLGFKGIVNSDSGITTSMVWGVENLTVEQRYKKGIDAGVDIYSNDTTPEHVVNLVRKGELSQARVDESARRILRVRIALGHLREPLRRCRRGRADGAQRGLPEEGTRGAAQVGGAAEGRTRRAAPEGGREDLRGRRRCEGTAGAWLHRRGHASRSRRRAAPRHVQ